MQALDLGYYVSVADIGGIQAAFCKRIRLTIVELSNLLVHLKHLVLKERMQLWIAFVPFSNQEILRVSPQNLSLPYMGIPVVPRQLVGYVSLQALLVIGLCN